MSFLKDLKNPFNLITFVLTLIFGVLSIVFYFKSKNERSISYYIEENPSLIYDSNNSSSRITVLENDSIPLDGNVYLITGQIWNDGNLPIDKQYVRKQLSIDLLSADKIIDYKIIKQTNKEISQFKLKKISKNSLNVNWQYFDPDNGFRFQIIYLGREDPDFNISGNILGIRKIKNSIKSSQQEIAKNKSRVVVGFACIFCAILFSIIKVIDKNNDKENSTNIHLYFMEIGLIIMGVFLLYLGRNYFFNDYLVF